MSTQTRTHNVQNEITSVSGQASPTYDLNGNQTRDFAGQTFTFDAWNRLVKVTPSGGGAPIREYEYDARFRRIEETAGTTTTDFYYSSNWQVLEEHVDNTLESQFVWSPTYIDALILRDRNVDGNSSNGLEERLWVLQDANYNVTALVNSNGVVVERYPTTRSAQPRSLTTRGTPAAPVPSPGTTCTKACATTRASTSTTYTSATTTRKAAAGYRWTPSASPQGM